MPLVPANNIEVKDEGTIQGRVRTLDFVGASVVATVSGSVGTITVSGGSGSFTISSIEVNLGTAAWEGKFVVTDAAVSSSSKINVWQAPGPYTGKGTLADEAAMDPLWCVAAPGAGTFTVHWKTLPMIVPIPYGDGGGWLDGVASSAGKRSEFDVVGVRRLGRVKGNVKFQYTVA